MNIIGLAVFAIFLAISLFIISSGGASEAMVALQPVADWLIANGDFISKRTGLVEGLAGLVAIAFTWYGLRLAKARTSEMGRSNDNAEKSIETTQDMLLHNERVFENSRETKFLELYKAGAELIAGDKIVARISGIHTWSRLVHQTNGEYAEGVALQLLRVATNTAFDQETRFAALMELGYIRLLFGKHIDQNKFTLAAKSNRIDKLKLGSAIIANVDWSDLRITTNYGPTIFFEHCNLQAINWLDDRASSISFAGCNLAHTTMHLLEAETVSFHDCVAKGANILMSERATLDPSSSDLTGANSFSGNKVSDGYAIACWYEGVKPHFNILGDRKNNLFRAIDGETKFRKTIGLGLKIYIPTDN